MKKTLLHITEVSSGGVLPVIANICNGLCDKYHIVVAYGIRFDTPENIEDFFDGRVKLIVVKNFTRGLSLRKDLAAVRELREVVREVRPDIIHLHSGKAGLLGRIGLPFYKAEKYYTPHGYSFQNQEESPFRRRLYRLAEKILARTGYTTIACGRHEFAQAQRLGGKAEIVNNGIDTEHIDTVLEDARRGRPREEGRREGYVYTVYTAGRIWAQKNPQLFDQIAGLCPDINFLWIGRGEDEGYVFQNRNVEVTGLVDRDQAIRLADHCDCYVSCSLGEGLPMALLEAMYLEKPCVVSDVGGNNDLVTAGQTGWFAASAGEFAAYIRELSKRDEKNSRAREMVIREYSMRSMCEGYGKIYG